MGWNFKPGIPLYTQIEEILIVRICSGIYPVGGDLPTVRDLAITLAVNPNTVQRAYSELEEMGLIITHRTSGRTVTEDKEPVERVRRELAENTLSEAIQKLKSLKIGDEEIKEIFHKELSRYDDSL